MKGKKISLSPRALDKYNAESFAFLVMPEAVEGMKKEDGTAGFAVMADMRYVGALCGRFVSGYEYKITSLYVSPGYRRRGVGTFMMNTLLEILSDYQPEITIEVTRTEKDSFVFGSFMESLGFEEYMNDDAPVYMTDLGTIEGLPITAPSGKLNIKPFGEIPEKNLRGFKPKTEEDFVPVPRGGFKSPDIDREISMGILTDNVLTSFALVEKYDEKSLGFSSIYVGDKDTKMAFISLIKAVRDAAMERYTPDTLLYIPVVNDKIGKVVESLFPEGTLYEGTVTYKKTPEPQEYAYERISLDEFLISEGADLSEHLIMETEDEAEGYTEDMDEAGEYISDRDAPPPLSKA